VGAAFHVKRGFGEVVVGRRCSSVLNVTDAEVGFGVVPLTVAKPQAISVPARSDQTGAVPRDSASGSRPAERRPVDMDSARPSAVTTNVHRPGCR
jgi:hypothetical protein